MIRRRACRVTAIAGLAAGMTLVAGSAASAATTPEPAIAVAGVSAVGLSIVVAPASQYAVTVTNVGDGAATSSDDDPSSIAIEGASPGAVASGAGLRCAPGVEEIDCVFDPALVLNPGEAVVVNVGGVTPGAAGDGAIFSVTADFNGSESSVDVCTSAETYDSTAGPASDLASGLRDERTTAAAGKTSPALKIHRAIRAHTVTVTVGHAKGAAGTLIVTATQGRVRGRAGARRAPTKLKVTRRKIAGRSRYRFVVRAGVYTVAATWTGTGRWVDQTKTRTYRTR